MSLDNLVKPQEDLLPEVAEVSGHGGRCVHLHSKPAISQRRAVPG